MTPSFVLHGGSVARRRDSMGIGHPTQFRWSEGLQACRTPSSDAGEPDECAHLAHRP